MELLQNSMELLIAKSIILQTAKMRKLSMEVPQNSIQLNRWNFYKTPYKWNIHAILINHQMPKFLKVETFPINQEHWSPKFFERFTHPYLNEIGEQDCETKTAFRTKCSAARAGGKEEVRGCAGRRDAEEWGVVGEEEEDMISRVVGWEEVMGEEG